MVLTEYAFEIITPLVAAIASVIVGVMTHRRTKKAHADTVTVDHTRLIQEGYQDILDQLRSELDRRKESEDKLRTRLNLLESELEREISLRKQLQNKVQELLEEVSSLREDYNDDNGS